MSRAAVVEPKVASPAPSLGREGLTAQSASEPFQGKTQGKPDKRGKRWTAARAMESAARQYDAVLSSPAAWQFTDAWKDAKRRREACEAGKTGWLVGESQALGRAGSIRMGCGHWDCKRCRGRRAQEVKARIDELMDGKPCVMLALTLQHAEIDMFTAWATIGECWRLCWERLVRHFPEELMEMRQVEAAVEGKMRRAVTPHPEMTFNGHDALKGPYSSFEDMVQMESLAETKTTRIPMAWVKEAHASGYPHMHVALALSWFGKRGTREGYDALAREWYFACQEVTGIRDAGGWVFMTASREDDRSAGRYLASYFTEEKHEVPESIRAYLWGEQRRMWGCTGRKRHVLTEEETAEAWERSTWNWTMFTVNSGRSAESQMKEEMHRLVVEGMAVTPWSAWMPDAAIPDMRCLVAGETAYYFTKSFEACSGEVQWINTGEESIVRKEEETGSQSWRKD